MNLKYFNLVFPLLLLYLFTNFSFSQIVERRKQEKQSETSNIETIKVGIKGGVVFQSLNAWIDGLQTSDPYFYWDQEKPSPISSISFAFPLKDNQSLELEISLAWDKISARNNSTFINLGFRTYYISAIYKYFFHFPSSRIKPFLGSGLYYLVNHIKYTYSSYPDYQDNLTAGGLGGGVSIGALYSLSNKVDFSSELKFNYQDSNIFSSFELNAKHFSTNLLFGVFYKL